MAFAVLENVTLSIVPRIAILSNVTLSVVPRRSILDNITLSVAPSSKVAYLDNIKLSHRPLIAIFDNVTLSVAPPITPITGYLSFSHILTGSLADNLMEIYYPIVQGYSYGNLLDPEVVRVNRLLGRYNFKVVFSDETVLERETYYEFVYYFVEAVASGKRLKGSNDVERHMSLAKHLPSTFNPNWSLPVAIY